MGAVAAAVTALGRIVFLHPHRGAQHVPVLTVVWLRVGLSALALQAFLAILGHRMAVSARAWLAFVGMGFLNNAVPFTLIVWSETHIGAGLASVLNATTPLFTALVAHGLTKDEKLSAPRIAGLVAGFLGVTVMIGPNALSGLHAAALSQFAILGTALAYVIYFRILAVAGATNLLLVTMLIPATAILLGVLVLGEHLQAHQLLGMLCIACGLIIMDGRVIRLLGRRSYCP